MSPSKEPVPLHHSLQGPSKATPTPSSSLNGSQPSHWVPPSERDALGGSQITRDRARKLDSHFLYSLLVLQGEAKRKPPSGAHLPLTIFRTSANFPFCQRQNPRPAAHHRPLHPQSSTCNLWSQNVLSSLHLFTVTHYLRQARLVCRLR